MNKLNEVFTMILNEYQKTGSLDEALKVVDLTAEQKERIQKAFQTLDAIEANARSLREAKEEGISRKNWLANQIMTSAKDKNLTDEQTEEVFTVFGKKFAKTINNTEKKD
ncbi:MAG: hypothetical protein HDS39_01740 [Bacteroides sp.]|nr:hypothetical protein [Bacteroides sp.]